jgi:hypothetical protein
VSGVGGGLFFGGLPGRLFTGAPGTSMWLSVALMSDRAATDSRSSSCCREVDPISNLIGALFLEKPLESPNQTPTPKVCFQL